MVRGEADAIPPPWRYRTLVPGIARPIFELAAGRVGSWAPDRVALLLVNAGFTAGTALLILSIGGRLRLDPAVGAVAALLYLLNFSTINFNLAGLVDSFEAFWLLLLVRMLIEERWALLPMFAITGVVGKETYLPLAILMACGWWAFSSTTLRQYRALLWIGAAAVGGLATLAFVQRWVDGGAEGWNLTVAQAPAYGFLGGVLTSLTSPAMLYVFGWLVPLAIFRLSRLPAAWLWRSGSRHGGWILPWRVGNDRGQRRAADVQRGRPIALDRRGDAPARSPLPRPGW